MSNVDPDQYCTIEIIDMNGKVVDMDIQQGSTYKMDLNNRQKGYYILRLSYKNSTFSCGFVKK